MSLYENNRKKILICAFLIIASFFLIGAGKVTKELKSRKINRAAEHQQWFNLVSAMAPEIPAEHRQEWIARGAEDPKFFLKICTVDFRTVKKGDL